MNNRSIEIFYKVYECLSMKKASDELYISPQAISKAIINLEKEYNCLLFHRTGHNLIPTLEGERLYSRSKQLLYEFNLLKDSISKENSIMTTITIASTYGIIEYLGIDFFKKFYQEYNDLALNIVEMPDNDIISRLKNNLIDFAILSAPIDTILFDAKYLFTNHFCCIISNKNSLSNKELIDYKDLKDQKLAIKGKEYSVYTLNSTRLLSHQIFPHIILETSSDHLIHQFAKENLAIGVTLDYLASKDIDNSIKLINFKDKNFSRDIFLCTEKNVAYNRKQEIFYEFIMDYLNKRGCNEKII